MSDPYPKPIDQNPTLPMVQDGEIFKNVGKYSRSAVLFAFEAIGGPTGLAHWANKNQDEFYTKLFPKIIARESEVTHHRTVDQLMDVIDGEYEIDEDVIDVSDKLPEYGGQGQVIPQVAHNWNASDAAFDDQAILSEASENVAWPHEATICGADLVDFEE